MFQINYITTIIFFISLLLIENIQADNNFRNYCAEGDLENVLKLLKDGEDPNQVLNESGNQVESETPLHLACIRGYSKIVKSLLDYGADPNPRATGLKSLRMTPLTWCVYGGKSHSAAVEELLIGGADPNLVVDDEQGNKITPLDIAIKIGDEFGGKTKKLVEDAGGLRYSDLKLSSEL
jgi:ankyrin repeat protein